MFCPALPKTLFTAAITASALSAMPVFAHDAESGWMYPLACCSGYDCREVADSDVVEGPQGYVIKVTGEVIPMTSSKVKPSPDGVFHWCSVAGKDDGKTICLFVPPRAF